MAKQCDNKSVGALIYDEQGRLLMIERKKFPFGIAPPAGHVDDHGKPQDVVIAEVQEEVGLMVVTTTLKAEGSRKNVCRREGGDHHYWVIYTVTVTGTVQGSVDETKSVGWYTKEQIARLARRTEAYRASVISEDEWQESPGLEEVWYDWFQDLNII